MMAIWALAILSTFALTRADTVVLPLGSVPQIYNRDSIGQYYFVDPLTGFQVVGSSKPQPIPVTKPTGFEPMKDTPEVEAVKKEHFKLVEEERRKIAAASLPFVLRAPIVTAVPDIKSGGISPFIIRKENELSNGTKPEIIVRDPIITGSPYVTPSLPFIQPIGLTGFDVLNRFNPYNVYNPYSPLVAYNSTLPTGAPLLFDYRVGGGAPLVLV